MQGDAALLRQLLLNLFGNGLKFHRPDVAPVVRVDARRVGEYWEFAVTDNGIGVEPEYAEKIFVIFQRLHGRERLLRAPGSGSRWSRRSSSSTAAASGSTRPPVTSPARSSGSLSRWQTPRRPRRHPQEQP